MTLRQTTRVGSSGIILSAVVVLLIAAVGCNQKVDPALRSATAPSQASADKKVSVFVVNYPLAFLAERIGGERVTVGFSVPPDQDPAFWEPDVDDVLPYQSADLILINGADYAKWTLRTSLPLSRTVITTREVEDQYIEVPNVVTHSHGPEGEHSHAGIASETWIDPHMAVSQASVVKDELLKLLPDSTEELETNFEALKNDLRRLDGDFNDAFASSTLPWTASHPAFHYIGRRYGLNLQAMNWDPTEVPSDEQWETFDKLLGGAESSLMLWTEAPNPETLGRLEQRGVRVVVFHLAANRPESGDYLGIMHENLSKLRGTLAP